MASTLIHQYLERLCNLLRAESRRSGADFGLQPVQMDALNYLANCNRYSDTPQAVTDYLGTTKGTVSQTLNILEEKGLIAKARDAADKRVVHLHVTSAGISLLKQSIPAPLLDAACRELPPDEQEHVVSALRSLLTAWQRKNGSVAFGQCKTCRYNQRRNSTQYFCGLTQENLTRKETELLCREHAA